jgi:hypothetical protein
VQQPAIQKVADGHVFLLRPHRAVFGAIACLFVAGVFFMAPVVAPAPVRLAWMGKQLRKQVVDMSEGAGEEVPEVLNVPQNVPLLKPIIPSG